MDSVQVIHFKEEVVNIDENKVNSLNVKHFNDNRNCCFPEQENHYQDNDFIT